MFGQMAMPIQVNGNKIKKMGSEKFLTAMNIMKGNLYKVNKMEMDHSFIIMGQYIKANGKKMKDKEKAN